MKAHLAWKQLKVDHSKNILKEGNCGYCFVCPLFGDVSLKKIIENCNYVGTGAHEVGEVVIFWPNFEQF